MFPENSRSIDSIIHAKIDLGSNSCEDESSEAESSESEETCPKEVKTS